MAYVPGFDQDVFISYAQVDNVGVMSYRPRATGSNGIIACCQTEFDLGARNGVEVFASVETGGGSDVERGTSFFPYPASTKG